MTTEYAVLEARVSALELQVQHVLPVKIHEVSYGLSLVRADTLQIRATQDTRTAALEQLETRLERLEAVLERQETRLDRHGELLVQIVGRLPELPAA